MRKILLFLIIVSFNYLVLPQSYFPVQPGYKWYYKNMPLDTLNNPQTEMTYYEIDSFAVFEPYQGKNAFVTVNKYAPAAIINNLPYTDTSYISVEGSKAFIYNNALLPDTLLSVMDSSIISLAKKFEQWYGIFNFNATVNQNVTIFTFDTTVTIDSITLPLRFDVRSKRLSDKNVITEAGTFLARPFFVSRRLGVVVGIPPFAFTLSIVDFTDSVYLSENMWIVKQVAPSTTLDLSYLNFGKFNIAGNHKELVPVIVSVENDVNEIEGFYLGQNYPNPFNPETVIDFSIPENANTKIIVYNVQGEEVITLIDSYLQKGKHQISLSKNNLPSGVYFYRLISGSNSSSRKMLLLK